MKKILIVLLLPVCCSVKAQHKDSLLSGVFQWKELTTTEKEHGTYRQLLLGKTFALESLEIGSTILPEKMKPVTNIPAKNIEHLIIVKEGTVKLVVLGKSKVIGPGSVALVMPGESLTMENVGTTASVFYHLKYDGKFPTDTARANIEGGSIILDWNDLGTINTGKGYRRNFFDRGTSQLRKFEMHTTALNADSSSHAPDTHIQEEIVLILRGNVELQIGDKTYKAAAGDFYFLSSNIPHALTNIGKVQCEYFAFQWRN